MSFNERFSGHESFVCRYGWLPKAFNAVRESSDVLRDEERAMEVLGIGRNMVRSIQFWAEAAGVIRGAEEGGHVVGPVGEALFGKSGWDPYLETVEGLWLIHWRLSTRAGMAAWNEVFGEGKLTRFDRQGLISALAARSQSTSRPLAVTTLQQHASIFIQSYFQEEHSNDDTSWCPLQDLGLIRAIKDDSGKLIFNADAALPVGLSNRVFAMALIDFVAAHGGSTYTVAFHQVLKGPYSPGQIFRLDEAQLRFFIENLSQGILLGALRFVDTADTQNIVLSPNRVDAQYRLNEQQEISEHA